jgi:hypothetical protein
MNPEWIQALAELAGLIIVLGNAAFWAVIYRMQASFVTRAEHGKMGARVDKVETDIDDINEALAKVFTNEQAEQLYNRLGVVEKQGATLIGQLEGTTNSLGRLGHQLDLLFKNELDKGRDHKR